MSCDRSNDSISLSFIYCRTFSSEDDRSLFAGKYFSIDMISFIGLISCRAITAASLRRAMPLGFLYFV